MSEFSEYPDEETLVAIRDCDIFKTGIMPLVNLVIDNWWSADQLVKMRGKNVIYLELHTGGWSGNEELIDALQMTKGFWGFCWLKSTRGGHYYFKIDKKLWEEGMKKIKEMEARKKKCENCVHYIEASESWDNPSCDVGMIPDCPDNGYTHFKKRL